MQAPGPKQFVITKHQTIERTYPNPNKSLLFSVNGIIGFFGIYFSITRPINRKVGTKYNRKSESSEVQNLIKILINSVRLIPSIILIEKKGISKFVFLL